MTPGGRYRSAVGAGIAKTGGRGRGGTESIGCGAAGRADSGACSPGRSRLTEGGGGGEMR